MPALMGAANKGRGLNRQVLGAVIQRRERWKVGGQIRRDELKQVLQVCQTFHAMLAHVAQGHIGGQIAAHDVGHFPRQQNLAAMAGGHDPRDPIERVGGAVIVALRHRRTDIDAPCGRVQVRWSPRAAPRTRAGPPALPRPRAWARRTRPGTHRRSSYTRARRGRRWRCARSHGGARAPSRICSGSRSHKGVLPSISVNRKVTIPLGRSAMAHLHTLRRATPKSL